MHSTDNNLIIIDLIRQQSLHYHNKQYKEYQSYIIVENQTISSLRYFDIIQMHAPQHDLSSVRINFGAKSHGSTPLNLSFLASFFSTEQDAIKNEIRDTVAQELPETYFAFELVSKHGDPSDIANKLNNSDVIKNIREISPTSVTFHVIHKKLYAILTGEEISYLLEEFNLLFAQLKGASTETDSKIKLTVSSQNDLGTISELLKDRTYKGWFDSLHLDFSFVKTELNVKILNIVLEKLGATNFTGLVKAFKKIDLQLNLSSSHVLKDYPKLKLETYNEAEKNQFAVILADTGIQYVKFYGFNPSVYLTGDLTLSGLSSLLYSVYK